MDLTNYKKVDYSKVAREIEKELGLTWKQTEKLCDYLQESPNLVVCWNNSPKSNPIFRLTAPFYLVYWVLLFIFMPIKWLFTGTAYYKHESLIYKSIKWWKNKLNF